MKSPITWDIAGPRPDQNKTPSEGFVHTTDANETDSSTPSIGGPSSLNLSQWLFEIEESVPELNDDMTHHSLSQVPQTFTKEQREVLVCLLHTVPDQAIVKPQACLANQSPETAERIQDARRAVAKSKGL